MAIFVVRLVLLYKRQLQHNSNVTRKKNMYTMSYSLQFNTANALFVLGKTIYLGLLFFPKDNTISSKVLKLFFRLLCFLLMTHQVTRSKTFFDISWCFGNNNFGRVWGILYQNFDYQMTITAVEIQRKFFYFIFDNANYVKTTSLKIFENSILHLYNILCFLLRLH